MKLLFLISLSVTLNLYAQFSKFSVDLHYNKNAVEQLNPDESYIASEFLSLRSKLQFEIINGLYGGFAYFNDYLTNNIDGDRSWGFGPSIGIHPESGLFLDASYHLVGQFEDSANQTLYKDNKVFIVDIGYEFNVGTKFSIAPMVSYIVADHSDRFVSSVSNSREITYTDVRPYISFIWNFGIDGVREFFW